MSSDVQVQVQVSPDTNTVSALYVWREGHDWQAGFSVAPDGACTVMLERTDETDALGLHPDGGQQAAFPSLHAALVAYREHPLAVPGISTTPYGEVVVG